MNPQLRPTRRHGSHNKLNALVVVGFVAALGTLLMIGPVRWYRDSNHRRAVPSGVTEYRWPRPAQAVSETTRTGIGSKLPSDFAVSKHNTASRQAKRKAGNRRPRSRHRSRPVPAFDAPPLPLPRNGQIVKHSGRRAIAPFRIVTRGTGEYYYVKLVDWRDHGKTVLTVFVRGGEQVDLKVPLGSYELRYATGKTWYGPTHLFGPETRCSRAQSRLDFKQRGRTIQGHTVELYRQVGGNLATDSVSAARF